MNLQMSTYVVSSIFIDPLAMPLAAVDITVTKQPKDSKVPIGGKFHLVCIATNPHNKKMKYEWFQIQANGSMYSLFLIAPCDSHVIISFKENKYLGEGEEFSGQVPDMRNAELKFFCKVSLEGNSAHYTQSQIAKVKVQTGTCRNLFNYSK